MSFQTAARVFEDDLRLEFSDVEHSWDEDRYLTFGLVQDVLAVVYCDRVGRNENEVLIRIISARLATKKEQKLYNDIVNGRL